MNCLSRLGNFFWPTTSLEYYRYDHPKEDDKCNICFTLLKEEKDAPIEEMDESMEERIVREKRIVTVAHKSFKKNDDNLDHPTHAQCIAPWMKISPQCPTCRAPLDKNSLIRIAPEVRDLFVVNKTQYYRFTHLDCVLIPILFIYSIGAILMAYEKPVIDALT